MMKKSIILSFILLICISIMSLNVYADSELTSNIILSSDPVHPYIHEIMDNENPVVRIFDEKYNDVTESVKKQISKYYSNNDYEMILEYLGSQEYYFNNNGVINKQISNNYSVSAVPFSFTDKYIQSPYNLEMIFTITNQIFISNDKFSGYTTPIWHLDYESPQPISLVTMNLDPSIVNSGYTYRLDISFIVSYFHYVYPKYKNVVFYHYI